MGSLAVAASMRASSDHKEGTASSCLRDARRWTSDGTAAFVSVRPVFAGAREGVEVLEARTELVLDRDELVGSDHDERLATSSGGKEIRERDLDSRDLDRAVQPEPVALRRHVELQPGPGRLADDARQRLRPLDDGFTGVGGSAQAFDHSKDVPHPLVGRRKATTQGRQSLPLVLERTFCVGGSPADLLEDLDGAPCRQQRSVLRRADGRAR